MIFVYNDVIMTKNVDRKNYASVAMLGIAVFSTKNLTNINNSINFQNFVTNFGTVVARLFSIISCKFCLNWLRFIYFIIKRVGLQFFSDTL